MRRGRLVVFAKQPVPGAVKTRLVPPFSAEEAADFYACMLEDVLVASAAMARELDLEAVLAVHPGRFASERIREAPAPFSAVAQCGAGLAERMAWVLGEAAAADTFPVLLRSSDSPQLGPESVRRVLHSLADDDVAIVPDQGGGYTLIGLAGAASGIFDHPMSTRTVVEDTRNNAAQLGLRVRTLPPCPDIDEVPDLRQLAEQRRHFTELCPRTLAFLDDHDLWRHLDAAAHPDVSR